MKWGLYSSWVVCVNGSQLAETATTIVYEVKEK